MADNPRTFYVGVSDYKRKVTICPRCVVATHGDDVYWEITQSEGKVEFTSGIPFGPGWGDDVARPGAPAHGVVDGERGCYPFQIEVKGAPEKSPYAVLIVE